MGSYKDQLERSRSNMSPEAIHAAKCQLKKSRHEMMRLDNIARMKARPKHTPQEWISILDRRLGRGKGAVSQRARLSEKIKQINEQKAAAPIIAAHREARKTNTTSRKEVTELISKRQTQHI